MGLLGRLKLQLRASQFHKRRRLNGNRFAVASAFEGLEAAAGRLVEYDAVPDIFSQVEIPKRLAKLLIDCTEPVPARRPAELAPLLKELTAWQKKATR